MALDRPRRATGPEYLGPLGVTQHQLAALIGVPPRQIDEIVQGKSCISANTPLRLARVFGTSERFWMNLQARYDLEVEKDKMATTLEEIQLWHGGLCRELPGATVLTSCQTRRAEAPKD